MTVQNPAVFLQSEAHPAEDVRRMFGAMAGASGGIVAASDLEVTETSGAPTMGVDVAGGQVWIPGTEATYQGIYFAENRGVETLTIGASDPTNGRYDLIVAKIEDSAYSGSVNAWSLVVVAGTADPSPVDPATPANSITLARVTVGAGVSTITDANITDLRTFADGSPAYAADSLATYADSTARTSAVPSPSEGDISYLADTDTVEVYDGSAWAAVGGAGGLVPLVTEDFTSVSAVNIDNVFTADYRAYKIVLRQTNISTNTTMLLRLRASGVSKTANYQTERFYGYGSNVAASTDPTGTDDWYLGNLNTTYPDRYMFEGTLFDPYNTNVKMGVAQVTMREASVFTSMNLGLTLDDTSLCDGISVFPGAGTFSGTITIYGMTEAT